eukprot:364818-Chlamydomonas_euryale.AAC.37
MSAAMARRICAVLLSDIRLIRYIIAGVVKAHMTYRSKFTPLPYAEPRTIGAMSMYARKSLLAASIWMYAPKKASLKRCVSRSNTIVSKLSTKAVKKHVAEWNTSAPTADPAVLNCVRTHMRAWHLRGHGCMLASPNTASVARTSDPYNSVTAGSRN